MSYPYKQNKVTLDEVLHHSDSEHNLSMRIRMDGGQLNDGLEEMEFIDK